MIRHALTYTKAYLGKYIKNEKGQTLVEYALIIAVIGVVIVASLTIFRGKIEDVFEAIGDALNDAPTPPSGS